MRWLPVIGCGLLLACSEDSGPDATLDAGVAGGADAAQVDAQSADAGPGLDAGFTDAGAPEDAGVAGPLTWAEAAPLAGGPRQETAVVAWRGEVIVVGGYDDNADFGPDVEAYDPGTNRWRSLPDLPAPMHHANLAVLGDTLWVVGFLGAGFVQDGRIFSLEAGASAWQARGEMPQGRARGASVTQAHGGWIYVAGGLSNVAPVSFVDRFDPATGTWQPLPPLPRLVDHAVGGIIGDALYVAGGRAGLIDAHVPDLDVLDLGTFEWGKGPDMGTSRGGAAGAVLDGRLFVIGGEGNPANPPSNLFVEVEAYDPQANTWEVLAPLSPPRHGMGAATVGGRIWVPGGADVQAFGAVDTHASFGP